MRALRAFLLGALAIGLLAYVAAAALAAAAQAGNRAFTLGLGPVELVSVVEHGSTTATTFGVGLLLLALAGGLANVALATLIARRPRRGGDPLD